MECSCPDYPWIGEPTCPKHGLAAQLERLRSAARDIYYAGVWTCDRPVDEAALWTALRDAAGFTPGESPKPIA